MSNFGLFVMHFDGENFTLANVRCGMSWEEHNFFILFDDTLFNTSGQDITDTLNFVDTGDWHAHGGISWSAWELAHFFHAVIESINMDFVSSYFDIISVPPRHFFGFLEQVVSAPT